jgi:hypothetical protein
MRHVSQNVNQNVYETGFTFGKIDPLGQGHMGHNLNREREDGRRKQRICCSARSNQGRRDCHGFHLPALPIESEDEIA